MGAFKKALSFALLLAIASAVNATTDELIIDVEHKPKDCKQKTKAGDNISVHYSGFLVDGTKFDSSRDRNQPFDFRLGSGQVIAGWDEGLQGACVGEKRKLTIPPSKGYGDRGAGGVIPPKATLVFETEVLAIK